MLYALDDHGVAVRPGHTGERASCPSCHTEMRSHCGERVINYWAHVSLEECDSWVERFSTAEGHQWHLDWQDAADKAGARIEVSVSREVPGRGKVLHRADIMAADGSITEVQHSNITAADIREREWFYRRMIWIWNATGAYRENRLRLWLPPDMPDGDGRRFAWSHIRASVLDCQRPVLLDLGWGKLLHVASWSPLDSPVRGTGNLVTREQVIDWIANAPPLVHPIVKPRKQPAATFPPAPLPPKPLWTPPALPPAAFTPRPEPTPLPVKREYPSCDRCGRPLWAPVSQERGYCERCHVDEIRRAS